MLKPYKPASIEITGNTSLTKGTEAQFTATVKDTAGNVLNCCIADWSCSADWNTARFVKSRNNAWATPKKLSAFTVTASYEGFSQSVNCTVAE